MVPATEAPAIPPNAQPTVPVPPSARLPPAAQLAPPWLAEAGLSPAAAPVRAMASAAATVNTRAWAEIASRMTDRDMDGLLSSRSSAKLIRFGAEALRHVPMV